MISGSYTVPFGDGIMRLFAETTLEVEPKRIADASLDAGGRIESPRTGIGRLVFDTHVLRRFRNYMNRRSVIGGDTRLRGYTTLAYIGQDVVSFNLEFRARPIQLWSFQLGGILFYDAGDAFDGFSDMRMKHSVGVGLRAVFPQLDRSCMRVDWGFPLTRAAAPEGPFPGQFVITFQQAFPMPSIPVRDFRRVRPRWAAPYVPRCAALRSGLPGVGAAGSAGDGSGFVGAGVCRGLGELGRTEEKRPTPA